ncbi:hypothetical protein [Burkholderia gladioli]|uniref:hypothetical protein n=1 Tax=Burkholderia gladioli TaxID=28095 RepID=UPI001640A83E|nr:hypothetical protein [Burkholderia gladioli]
MAKQRDIGELRYALAKQVPAMERGFTIQTSCGELAIDAEDAGRFVALARMILTRKVEGAPARPAHFEAEALASCAAALRQAGAIFGVLDYYARGGDMERCDVVGLVEIGINITSRGAEYAEDAEVEVRNG